VVVAGYRLKWAWAGFSDYRYLKAKDEEVQRGKTLWDWLQLLVVPAALAAIALLFNQVQAEREQAKAEARARVDREIAADVQQEETLQNYIATMSELMLEKSLRASDRGSELRVVARTRTLTILRRLNGERKGILLRFLSDANLIRGPDPIVELVDADLSFTVATHAHLNGANLAGADMTGAQIDDATLRGADLHGAKLISVSARGVDLGKADLQVFKFTGADLSHSYLVGAITNETLQEARLTDTRMPDGSLHK